MTARLRAQTHTGHCLREPLCTVDRYLGQQIVKTDSSVFGAGFYDQVDQARIASKEYLADMAFRESNRHTQVVPIQKGLYS